MLVIMKLRNRLSSLLSVSSLFFIGLSALSGGSTGCGADQACFYFTQVEFDFDKACPSREEALTFFQGEFCSTSIISVDSDGTFDGETCCYDVTKSNDFFGCVGPDPVPPPFPGTTGSSSGIGGSGGVSTSSSSSSGQGGSGGGTCSTCATFLTNAMPNELCAGSVMLYEAFTGCMCSGACAGVCADNYCMGLTPTPGCESCSLDPNDPNSGCGQQHDACLADQ